MKKLYLLVFIVLMTSLVTAQPYGNEWINFSTNQQYSNQQYFRIKVWKEGIYRISYADLTSASFPMPFNPKQLQLFNNGREQFIYVEGEADGSFDQNDYIEFYGKKNDGEADASLYRYAPWQINPQQSLFTDTAAYFLTLNTNPFIVNRRMGQETDMNFIGYTPLPWVMAESYRDYKDQYNLYRLVDIRDSEYDEGEGWMSGGINFGPYTVNMTVPGLTTDPTAPVAQLSTTIMGGNNPGTQRTVTVSAHGASNSSTFVGFAVSKFNFPLLSNSSVGGMNVSVVYTLSNTPNIIYHISSVKVDYPRTLSFTGETNNIRKFTVPGSLTTGKAYLEFTGLSMSSPKLYMFSDDTLKMVAMAGTGLNRQALVPAYGNNRNCFLADTIYTSAMGMLQMEPVNQDPSRFAKFINYQYINQADYLIVTHKTLWNKAVDYKNYRSLSGYTPLLAEVEELYDQFAFGVAQHPRAIRNFCFFTRDYFTMKPEYLLLIGKSLNSTLTRITGTTDTVAINNIRSRWSKNLVPTFGTPSSDMLFATTLNDSLPYLHLSVGRISASTEDDVEAYLNKIIAHEALLQQCPQDWMKQILHFGGGNIGYEQELIKTILKGFENIARDTLWGATVTTYLKTTTDPIQVNLTQQLQARIDSGTTMMTFVAHAGGTTFDINTDDPKNYHNKDRYPLILANSCFVGDIHGATRKIVEDFVLLPEKGSIAFVAQPDVGYLANLQVYSNHFYSQTAKYNYGGTVGKTMKNAVDSLFADTLALTNSTILYLFKSLATGMTLSGDPALVMHSFDKPEYVIDNSSVFFTPEIVTSTTDSFDVKIVITNLGKAENKNMVVHLVRKFPDGGANFEMDTLIGYVAYKDTISIRLAVNSLRSVGPNYFDIYIDYSNTIDECNETNNFAYNVPLLIQSSDILPVYPAEYSIVPNSNIQLKASTVNAFAAVMPYAFQIDTVDTFNSPFLQQTIVSSAGGVVKWTLPFTLQPDLVYYWRVSRDSMPGDTIHPPWKESSFIHKAGITGWSQAHYSQFKKDDYTNVIYSNSYNNTFEFVQTASSLVVKNYKNPISIIRSPSIEINQVTEDYDMCGGQPSIHVFVIDSLSLKLWDTQSKNFGNVNYYVSPTNYTCRARPEKYFIFRDTPAQRDLLETMLTDSIPAGNYVGIYTVFDVAFSQWDQDLKNILTGWGSDSINFLNDGQPYIFFTKKGDNSITQEVIGDSINTDIVLSATLGGNWKKGFMSSVTIGPANGWTSLHWDQKSLESMNTADSIALDVIGITNTGIEVPVTGFTGIQAGDYDVNISAIDAQQYPKLKLRAYLQDTVMFSPPQMVRWQIYYNEIPELALNPAKYFKLNKDTLQEGEKISMEMAVENIGNVDADSVLVDFYLFDDDRVRHNISSPRYKVLVPGDTLIASVDLSTAGYAGLNSLWIEANPNNDQPEQYHFNNIAEIKFHVDRDVINPILDVTFDGVQIMNGDIVSGKPEINIKLKDENLFLALNDTAKWQVFLTSPDEVQNRLVFEPIACSGTGTEQMKWCPAALPDNSFKISYNPTLLQDGIYELRVQAADESGNLSGDNNYRISFEVISKSSITQVLNYPNPFSTSTRFVFTLTGSEVPDYFKVQIMTVSGKIVREITRDELGPIRIGRNITEYAWDGRDEFGDRLANGIYLYRVITRIKGSVIEQRETAADSYFTKGWGKMYLMR